MDGLNPERIVVAAALLLPASGQVTPRSLLAAVIDPVAEELPTAALTRGFLLELAETLACRSIDLLGLDETRTLFADVSEALAR